MFRGCWYSNKTQDLLSEQCSVNTWIYVFLLVLSLSSLRKAEIDLGCLFLENIEVTKTRRCAPGFTMYHICENKSSKAPVCKQRFPCDRDGPGAASSSLTACLTQEWHGMETTSITKSAFEQPATDVICIGSNNRVCRLCSQIPACEKPVKGGLYWHSWATHL